MKHIFNEVHYELTRKIAEGGMGLVYEATQKELVDSEKSLRLSLFERNIPRSRSSEIILLGKQNLLLT